MRPYGALMSPRKLFAIVIALALLLAPAFSRAGEALAAVPDDHHMRMVDGGHCQSAPSNPNDHGQAPEKSCCISMCMGVAVTPPAVLQAGNRSALTAFDIPTLHLSYLGEIATPPPKFA